MHRFISAISYGGNDSIHFKKKMPKNTGPINIVAVHLDGWFTGCRACCFHITCTFGLAIVFMYTSYPTFDVVFRRQTPLKVRQNYMRRDNLQLRTELRWLNSSGGLEVVSKSDM